MKIICLLATKIFLLVSEYISLFSRSVRFISIEFLLYYQYYRMDESVFVKYAKVKTPFSKKKTYLKLYLRLWYFFFCELYANRRI